MKKDNTIFVDLDKIEHKTAWISAASKIVITKTELPLGAVVEECNSLSMGINKYIIVQHTKHTDKRTLETIYVYILEDTRG